MCMKPEELTKIDHENLVKFYKRAIELKGGKGPFDQEQLENELLRRLRGEPFKTKEDLDREILDEMHS